MEVQEQMVETRVRKTLRGVYMSSQRIAARLCSFKRETVHHWLSGCTVLAGSEYLQRHNKALMVFVVEWAKKEALLEENAVYMIQNHMSERHSNWRLKFGEGDRAIQLKSYQFVIGCLGRGMKKLEEQTAKLIPKELRRLRITREMQIIVRMESQTIVRKIISKIAQPVAS